MFGILHPFKVHRCFDVKLSYSHLRAHFIIRKQPSRFSVDHFDECR